MQMHFKSTQNQEFCQYFLSVLTKSTKKMKMCIDFVLELWYYGIVGNAFAVSYGKQKKENLYEKNFVIVACIHLSCEYIYV